MYQKTNFDRQQTNQGIKATELVAKTGEQG
jgi:hypothetical protein